MNIYDATHSLARTIKSSKEYIEYSEKQKQIFGNPKIKEIVLDFRNKAMELQMSQMSGKELEPEKMEEIKKLEEVLMDNPVISEFLMAEMKFSQIMNDIYKILGEAIDLGLAREE